MKKPDGRTQPASAKGSSPAHNSGGGFGKSEPQKGIPGPETTGGPISLKRALAKKTMPSKGL